MTTTAKIEYVDYNCLDIRFCEVNFYGKRSEELAREWFTITQDKYNFYDNIADGLLALTAAQRWIWRIKLC